MRSACPPSAWKTRRLAQAALNAGSDYFDILVQSSVVSDLMTLANEICRAGCIFITQGGFHPGLPAVFVRQAAPYFDHYQKAIVNMAMNMRIEKAESVVEIIHEVGEFNAMFFKNGKWIKAKWTDMVNTDFGQPFGTRVCFPLQMDELKRLPAMFGLEETGGD